MRTAVIGGAAGSIFYVRNALLAGNPFAPMFGVEAPPTAGYRSMASAIETIGSYVFDRRFTDEALGISLLLLACVSIARGPSRFARRAALALLAAFACVALLTPSARILLPFLAVPALVGAIVVSRLGAAPRRAVASLIGVTVAVQLAVAALYLSAHRPFSLLLGEASVPNWLVRNRPVASDVLWIDTGLPARSRTLVLGIQEIFWFDHEVRGGGNFDGPRIAAYLRAGDARQLRERLERDGITHVAIGRELRVETASDDIKRRERETILDTATANTLSELLAQQLLVRQKGSLMLFELK